LGALLAAAAMASAARVVHADEPADAQRASELAKLPLEALFDVQVTSVMRQPQRLSEAASAIQVITGNEIRRSGATHLADVLRLAANVEVQQASAYSWVVSTRGFDALLANKLLVMIDGRTVYSPLDAGVFWDAQGVLLEDIDRVEIISGPGGTLWGANAVNGIIHIMTKRAAETQGSYASAEAGSFLRGQAAARWGGALGEHAHVRVWAQGANRNPTSLGDGDVAPDAWQYRQTGFRLDAEGAASSTTVQGDAYLGREYNSPLGTSTLDGQDLLVRWSRTSASGSNLEAQGYVDRTWRDDRPSTFSDQIVTYDASVQYRLPSLGGHDVLFGGGYRLMQDEAPTASPALAFLPVQRTLRLASAFVRDEWTLAPGRVRLAFGSKLERGEYDGVGVQPSVRVVWTPSRRQAWWAAASRALRAPSRIDEDYHVVQPPYVLAGGPDFHSERLVAYEAGWRAQPGRDVTAAVSSFYNHYDRLSSIEPQSSASPYTYTFQNGAAGQSWGFELSATSRPAPWWGVRAGYTWCHKDLWSLPGHDVLDAVLASLGNDPRDQATLASMFEVSRHGQLDVIGRYVDQLPRPSIPAYLALDARAAWTTGAFEWSVAGQNLLSPWHVEFDPSRRIPRSVHSGLSVRW
jgi:iron complex outermembrane receptor protein